MARTAGMTASDCADFACSATFRGFFLERDGIDGIEERPFRGNPPNDIDAQSKSRLRALERRADRLDGLVAMRQVEKQEAKAPVGAWKPWQGLAARPVK